MQSLTHMPSCDSCASYKSAVAPYERTRRAPVSNILGARHTANAFRHIPTEFVAPLSNCKPIGRCAVVARAEKDQETLPPWARKEELQKLAEAEGKELPFFVWLLASGLVAIAAVGSIYEFANKNAIFGLVGPDNFLYTPILGIFGLTGLPTAGFLFFRAVNAANKQSAQQDKIDGY